MVAAGDPTAGRAGARWRLVEPRPLASPSELRCAVEALARVGRRAPRPHDLDARDPAFLEDVIPLLDALYDRVFRCETELAAPLPRGPALFVANHNAMTGTPDMFCHMTAYWRLRSPKDPAYGLMHDVPFSVPIAGAWLNAAGAVAANRDNARRAVARGASVLVFPGGDLDACKPFRDRYQIDFGRRRGFVRLAIREGLPIVPVVSAGAHESLLLLARGDRFARAVGLDRAFRSNVFPVGFALPWGLVAGVPYPHVPLPVKIHTRILAPLELGLPPEAAGDDEAVEAAYRTLVDAMQAEMNSIAREGRHGLFPSRDGRAGMPSAAHAGAPPTAQAEGPSAARDEVLA